MPTADTVPQEVVQQVAEYFSILSEPMRLRILNLLREGEKCVQELVEATATSQANVSKHLKVMLQAGILSRRSEGTSAYYKVEDELIFELCNLVCDRLATAGKDRSDADHHADADHQGELLAVVAVGGDAGVGAEGDLHAGRVHAAEHVLHLRPGFEQSHINAEVGQHVSYGAAAGARAREMERVDQQAHVARTAVGNHALRIGNRLERAHGHELERNAHAGIVGAMVLSDVLRPSARARQRRNQRW